MTPERTSNRKQETPAIFGRNAGLQSLGSLAFAEKTEEEEEEEVEVAGDEASGSGPVTEERRNQIHQRRMNMPERGQQELRIPLVSQNSGGKKIWTTRGRGKK